MIIIILIITVSLCSLCSSKTLGLSLYKHEHWDFITRWKLSKKTLYTGNSLDELLAMCPNGCGPDCPDFPVYSFGGSVTRDTCDPDDIVVLREAQRLGKEWKDVMQVTPTEIAVHSIVLVIIFTLNLFLIVRGHYRFRDLWFLPSHRQWELERDPTWGLPGKVWGLLQMRVVKSDDPDSKPTDRKYMAYTDNPISLGDKFWYYKQALRDMYKTHKYYKRNRYFHKLAWQFTKLGKIIPETLRRHKCSHQAGELEEERSNASSAEADPQETLPWELDLADEVNLEKLKSVKVELQMAIDKEIAAGHFVNGRFQHHQHHHHHHHHSHQMTVPLTKEEVENTARQMELDPNADCVNVDGVMLRNPAAPKHIDKARHHHHHHHHNNMTPTHQSGTAISSNRKPSEAAGRGIRQRQ